MNLLRNLPYNEGKSLAEMIEILPHQVVSMALSKSEKIHMTLFAFAKGENISEESYLGDTVYLAVEGEVWIITDHQKIVLHPGEVVEIPSGILHAINSTDEFKMLQITVYE